MWPMAPEEECNVTDFLHEVDSQPEYLEKVAKFYSGEGAGRMKQWLKLLQSHPAVRFVGMGTSEIVPLLIRSRLESAGKAVGIIDAGEYLHYGPDELGDCMLRVLISQSGESAETKKATLALAEKNIPTVVVVNDEGSSMAAAASMVLPHAGGR